MSRKATRIVRGAVGNDGRSTNVTVVRGRLVASPTVRVINRQQRATTFDIASIVRGRRVVVPVVALNVNLPAIKVGDEVIAMGHIRRRFFRVGPRTQSVTEVVVEHLASGKSVAKAARVFDALLARCKEVRITTLPSTDRNVG